MPDKSNKNENTNYWPLILLSVGVIGLFAFSWWWLSTTINDPEEQGQFGDQFGAVNALFSGLAFAGLIFTIILQKKELALQREELSQTKDELRGQKEQLAEQNKTLKIQRFENTFFHMMELHQQIVSELSANQTEEIRKDLWDSGISFSKDFPINENISGRNLFYHAFCNIIHEITIADEVEKLRGLKEVLETYGFSYYDAMPTPTYFDHYFRHLYTILSFIDKNDHLLMAEEQYQYAKLLRATLSRYELVWLFYNGLSSYGNEKLKPLIERYCMLKNLRTDLLSLCSENRVAMDKAGISISNMNLNGYPGTDFPFFLTSEWGDRTKYNIQAFYNTFESQAKADTLLKKWNAMLDNNAS